MISVSDDIGSAVLNLVNVTDNRVLIQLNLTKECSGYFVSNHTSIPEGSFSYHLAGTDIEGATFNYDMKKKVRFEQPHFQSSDFSLSSNESSVIEMDRDALLKLNFTFTNKRIHDIRSAHSSLCDTYFNFTGSVPNGFINYIRPPYALVAGGASVQVEMLLRILHSSINRGTSHRVTLSTSLPGSNITLYISKTIVIVSGLKKSFLLHNTFFLIVISRECCQILRQNVPIVMAHV